MSGPCTNQTPSWFTGHWREWHRGHGCDIDDGKPRSTGYYVSVEWRGGQAALRISCDLCGTSIVPVDEEKLEDRLIEHSASCSNGTMTDNREPFITAFPQHSMRSRQIGDERPGHDTSWIWECRCGRAKYAATRAECIEGFKEHVRLSDADKPPTAT